MLEGLLWFCIAINVASCIFNIRGCVKNNEYAKHQRETYNEYIQLVLGGKRHLFKELGAYDSEKKGYMYLDLPGGLRLVIFEGKIDGWYMA